MSFAQALLTTLPSEPSCFRMGSSQSRQPCFFTLRLAEDLTDALLKPYQYFLESGPPALLKGQVQHMLGENADFAISLCTYNCYHHSISGILSSHINRHFSIPHHHHMAVHTCLQEAISNAIIHGNLGVHGGFLSSHEFHSYYSTVARRLADKTLARKRIMVSAWAVSAGLKLCVTDEGEGFSLEDAHAPDHMPCPTGRGFMIIQSLASSVWVGENKTSLYMSFNY